MSCEGSQTRCGEPAADMPRRDANELLHKGFQKVRFGTVATRRTRSSKRPAVRLPSGLFTRGRPTTPTPPASARAPSATENMRPPPPPHVRIHAEGMDSAPDVTAQPQFGLGSNSSLLSDGFSSKQMMDHMHSADAVGAFNLVATLVCGFAVTALIEVIASGDLPEAGAARRNIEWFCVLMALSAGLSGFATVFMTLEVYYLKRMADGSHALRLERFIEFTSCGRAMARDATYLALVAIFVGLSILAWDFLGGDRFAVAVASLFGLSSLAVVLMAANMQRLASKATYESITLDSRSLRRSRVPAHPHPGITSTISAAAPACVSADRCCFSAPCSSSAKVLPPQHGAVGDLARDESRLSREAGDAAPDADRMAAGYAETRSDGSREHAFQPT